VIETRFECSVVSYFECLTVSITITLVATTARYMTLTAFDVFNIAGVAHEADRAGHAADVRAKSGAAGEQDGVLEDAAAEVSRASQSEYGANVGTE
jgi:hypothetical protein